MIILCIGQAGCQIGELIIEQEAKFNPSSGYYSALFVDVDNKIINVLNESKVVSKFVKKVNLIKGDSGCLDKFTKKDKTEKFIQNILDHLRDEIIQQNNDCYIASVHSLIGSTSCSLLKIISEEVSERFENVKIVSFTTLPFKEGESSFQYYNAMLSLNVLRYFSLCFLISNDHMLEEVSKMRSSKKSISFSEINQIIASQIHMILKTLDRPSQKRRHLSSDRDTIPEKDPKILNAIADFSSFNCLYFMSIGMVEINNDLGYKKSLTKLSRKCVSYLKLGNQKEKPALHRALLFCEATDENQHILSAFSESFSTRFQVQAKSGETFRVYENTRGIAGRSQFGSGEKTLCSVCFQSHHLVRYMTMISEKVQLMLLHNAFLQYYSQRGRKGKKALANGKVGCNIFLVNLEITP
eukprot:TCONS_00016297-protein